MLAIAKEISFIFSVATSECKSKRECHEMLLYCSENVCTSECETVFQPLYYRFATETLGSIYSQDRQVSLAVWICMIPFVLIVE